MSSPLSTVAGTRKRLLIVSGAVLLVSMVGLGVMAENGWLPSTDPLTGAKTGWFGRTLPKNASSAWNPLAAPLPTPTPQLSKEYIYAGSRLLAVEDANANAAPPADLAVWRPTTGEWWVMGGQGSQQVTQAWGTSGDEPVQGDYDGDGKTDFSVFRPSSSMWYIVYSSTGATTTLPFGSSGDKAAPADFDGDGKTDPAVFRPGNGTWYIFQSSTLTAVYIQFGLSTDTPAPADYDGDGKADITVRRGSDATFYTIRSGNSMLQTAAFGSSADKPVPADYDGDGSANYALRQGAGWTVMNAAMSSTATTTPSGDLSTDIPVQNDFDADGKADIAVWRPSNGNWYIRNSSTGQLRQVQWGSNGDIPVPALYRR